jgi:formyltetrahydrofolate deformylase
VPSEYKPVGSIYLNNDHLPTFRTLPESCWVETLIISNHVDLRPVADRFGIPYHIPFTKDKEEGEQKQIMLQEYKINFIVLARYMQIITQI